MSSKPTDPSENKWKKIAEASQRAEEESLLGDEEGEGFGASASGAPDMDASSSEEPGLIFPSHAEQNEELSAIERLAEQYKEQAIRAKADLLNVQKRAERDVQNAHKYGAKKLLEDLLPVVDSIERGLQSAGKEDPMREGLQMTLDLLEKTLTKHGVEVISPKQGEPFNPEQQEAMTMQPGDGQPSNTVIKVMQKGYVLNGRVLRAAMVVVAS